MKLGFTPHTGCGRVSATLSQKSVRRESRGLPVAGRRIDRVDTFPPTAPLSTRVGNLGQQATFFDAKALR